MEYRREIDGLRALAVLPVILFHAGIEVFSGGFVGVDVFFVISGYLITTIIVSELERGTFSVVNFYERRARRILPALFLVMLVCIPFAGVVLLPSERKDFAESLVAVSLFASNVLFWRESGYFDTAAELKPLLHTWSLAVEEQFYILFPLCLMLFWRLKKRGLTVILGAVGLLSLGLAQWLAHAKPSAAFYLLPTRGWELLLGAFAALYLSQPMRLELGKRGREVAGWLGLSLIAYAVFAFNHTTPFPSVYTLAPTLGTVLIILASSHHTRVGRLLGSSGLVGIGLISYSAYLWHQPLLAFAKAYTFNLLALEAALGVVALSLGLAFLSYRYVETPFRMRGRVSRAQVFTGSALGLCFFIAVGALGHLKEGFPGAQAALTQAVDDWQHPGDLSSTAVAGFYKHRPGAPVDVLFFGDSHAEQLAPLASELAARELNLGMLSGGGCPPIPNLLDDLHPDCFGLFDRLEDVLRVEPQLKTLVFAGCFNCYFIDQARPDPASGDAFDYYYLLDQERLYFRKGKGQEEALAGLRQVLERLSRRYRVVLLGDNPSSDNFDPRVLMANALRGSSPFFKARYPAFTQGAFPVAPEERALNERLRITVPPEVTFLSLLEIVCPEGVCKATGGAGAPVYKDTNHMRPALVQEAVGRPLLELLE